MGKSLMQRFSACELTKSQLKIASYIMKNQKRILGMTAKKLGKEIGVSDATIIRFARVVGFEGYAELQEQIALELKEHSEKIGKHSLFDRYVMQFQKYNEQNDVGNEILRLMEENLETSIRQNTSELYERIADRLLKADRKVVIGLRGGNGVATQFARLLGHITSKVSVITTEGHDMVTKLTELDDEDAVVFLNFPRYFKIDEKMGSILAEQNVPIFLVTDSATSPIAKYAEEIVLVETEHCGFFHSMIGVTGVLEYLLILMCWRKPEEFRKRLQQRDAVLEEYLISKN